MHRVLLSPLLMAVAERVAHAHLIGVDILRIYRPIVHAADGGDATHARAVAQGGEQHPDQLIGDEAVTQPRPQRPCDGRPQSFTMHGTEEKGSGTQSVTQSATHLCRRKTTSRCLPVHGCWIYHGQIGAATLPGGQMGAWRTKQHRTSTSRKRAVKTKPYHLTSPTVGVPTSGKSYGRSATASKTAWRCSAGTRQNDWNASWSSWGRR